MIRLLIAAAVVVAVVVFGFSLVDTASQGEVSASALLEAPPSDISGFRRAIAPWDWQFPRDHGPHPDFQTEWWYYTGNLKTAEGRHFGYQFTIFRRAITPLPTAGDSEWRANQVYMAHFTLSDIDGEGFYHDQRLSRGGADLAGATADPRYRVWLEDWQVQAQDDAALVKQIQAENGEFAISLTLEQSKAPALQGNGGLSAKSDEPGNASYYYSLSRLLTAGEVKIGGEVFSVSGTSWMDHEFSTSALGENAQGWDWFGLYFDNHTELMMGQIRLNDGSREAAFGGLLIYPDGSTRKLAAADFTLTPVATWESPHTGAVYPSGWDVVIRGEEALRFRITPLMQDQELHGGGIEYWEGAVRISGDVTGYGYAELTGYVGTMAGRF